MNIPDTFKFVVPSSNNSIEFTATFNRSLDKYIIEWEDTFFEKSQIHNKVFYYKDIVAEYLENSVWVIITKQENNMKQQTIAQLEQNVVELLAKAEEMKKLIENTKKENTWPNIGDEFWYASSNGSVYAGYWANSHEDNNRLKFGNIHRSKVKAETYVQKRIVQEELERQATKAWKDYDSSENWDDYDQSKYNIYYENSSKKFVVDCYSISQYFGSTFFPTEESAIDAIKTIGEERLKVLLK